MKTIETTIVVDESRQATIQLPADVAPDHIEWWW